jgi:FMN phosphatase YigB (HAD superfamily)|tara:strand:+ start:3197 stop:3778 length:582 start_codon:yes stop_codon:yes gene_type:complete
MKNRKDLILTDVDGVLLDWETKFTEWMETKGFRPEPDQFSYEMNLRFGMKKHKIKELIREFNDSAWIGFLNPLHDAVYGVQVLKDAGWRFGAITSLSEDVYSGQLRERNLAQIFGEDTFAFVTCIDTGADKDNELLPYQDSGLYWIEDKPENALLGADLGLKTILMRHKHNANFHDDRIKVVDNWTQIVNTIT